MAGIRDTRDGKILENTFDLYDEIAIACPPDEYTKFCHALGFKSPQSQAILQKHHLTYKLALLEVLNTWEIRGEATREKLESAMKKAKTGGLCRIVARHFAKNAIHEDEESDEDVPSSSHSKTARNESHSSSSADESSEADKTSSRKRRKVAGKRSGKKQKINHSSPGPSTSNKKKKPGPEKVTDKVIESLAKDIGIDNNLDKLGLELEFKLSDMSMYTARNYAHGGVTYAGTKQMLIDWRKRNGQPAILKEALINSELTTYAEKYFDDL